MWRDINASLEVKIKTLKNNPFRFYMYEDVWIPRQNRVEILEMFLKTAEKEEKYELCRTIKELIVFLTALYDKENNYYKILLFTTEETRCDLEIKYFLIKSENVFKVYAEVDDLNDLYDHKLNIEITESLSVDEINQVLFKLFRYNELFNGHQKYISNGLLDIHDFEIMNRQLENKVI